MSVAWWPLKPWLPPTPPKFPRLTWTETVYQVKNTLRIKTIAPIPEIMIERGMSPTLGPAGDAGGGLEDGSGSIRSRSLRWMKSLPVRPPGGEDVEICVEPVANDR